MLYVYTLSRFHYHRRHTLYTLHMYAGNISTLSMLESTLLLLRYNRARLQRYTQRYVFINNYNYLFIHIFILVFLNKFYDRQGLWCHAHHNIDAVWIQLAHCVRYLLLISAVSIAYIHTSHRYLLSKMELRCRLCIMDSQWAIPFSTDLGHHLLI